MSKMHRHSKADLSQNWRDSKTSSKTPSKADLSQNWRSYSLPPAPLPPKMIYTHMALEDYPPYKQARMSVPIGLYGPEPYNPTLHTYSSQEYKDQLKNITRFTNIWIIWNKQKQVIQDIIYNKTFPYIAEFEDLRDSESPIDCYACQQKNYSYCKCIPCDNCGKKNCYGCYHDDDYDTYTSYNNIHYCGDSSCHFDCGTLSCGCIDVCRGRCSS